MYTVPTAGSDPLDQAFSRLSGSELRSLALQTRTCKIRDYLTKQVTGTASSFEEFAVHLENGTSHAIFKPRLAALLAQILAAQRLKFTDPVNALAIYDRIIDIFGSSVLTDEDSVIFADLLDRAGDRSDDVLKAIRDLEIANRAPAEAAALRSNATLTLEGPSSKNWLGALNSVLQVDGLSPLVLAPGSSPALDRLESTDQASSTGGPLVTVIVPTWRPGPWLWTAVRSLTQQTYANLQIVIMDDCSGPSFRHHLEGIGRMDSRIHVEYNSENMGSYASRNTAVRDLAKGDFVTIQDDDDWSHPQRIERQVAHARAAGLALSLARAARVTDDLRFVRRSATFIQRGYPTTLISRDTFFEIGFWDSARRNSDFEFIQRIRKNRKAWGDLGRSPLMLQRHRVNSLSSGEVWEGYSSQARRWQNWLAGAWHERSSSSGKRTYMPSGPSLQRPYPIPSGLAGNGGSPSAMRLDALVVHDYARDRQGESTAISVAKELLADGQTVGLLHVDGVHALAGQVSSGIASLAAQRGVSIVTWDDLVLAGTAHLIDVGGFRISDALKSNVSARSAIAYCELDGPDEVVRELFHLSDSSVISRFRESSDIEPYDI